MSGFEEKTINERELAKSKPAPTIIPYIIMGLGVLQLILTFAGVYENEIRYTAGWKRIPNPPIIAILIGIVLLACGILLFFEMRGCQLVITDKRVYGKGLFGKQVDIPIDSVSATAYVGWFKGVSVASSSGAIRFFYLENARELHSTLSELLIFRQKNSVEIVAEKLKFGEAGEIKNYKELLDMGAITQEEFDAKKKQLLGL